MTHVAVTMKKFAALAVVLCCTSALALPPDRDDRDRSSGKTPDWRPAALRTMRLAVGDVIGHPATLALYRDAGLNTVMVSDAPAYDISRSAWKFKTEDEIRSTTTFARVNGLPLIIGLAIEPFASIPQTSDADVRARLALWKSYGDDVILGVSPWYDDVFYDHVDAERQRHVYAIVKDAVPQWYVLGIIGEFGFDASEEDVARYYEPAAFDHLAVLMYPFNVGAQLTGFTLDTIGSADPDGDITRYTDRFFVRMSEKFFGRLRAGQQIVFVVQAFHYTGDPAGHIPRANDIRIMVQRGGDQVRAIDGQQTNLSIVYCCWGADGSQLIGLADRADWTIAARDIDQRIARKIH
jgi:hypothetical protein